MLSGRDRLGKPLALLLVCAVLSVQAAFLAAPHSHQGVASQCCSVCHAGQLPLLQTVSSSAILPPFHFVWLHGSDWIACEREPLIATGLSRAPPASLVL